MARLRFSSTTKARFSSLLLLHPLILQHHVLTCLLPAGNRITPSYVAFTEEERLVGDAAKNQAAGNPSNTIFDIKYVACFARLGTVENFS